MIDPMMSALDGVFEINPRILIPDFGRIQALMDAMALLENKRQQFATIGGRAWDILWDAREYLVAQFGYGIDETTPQFRGVCVHCLQSIHHDSQAWRHKSGYLGCHRYGQNVATPIGRPAKVQREAEVAA